MREAKIAAANQANSPHLIFNVLRPEVGLKKQFRRLIRTGWPVDCIIPQGRKAFIAHPWFKAKAQCSIPTGLQFNVFYKIRVMVLRSGNLIVKLLIRSSVDGIRQLAITVLILGIQGVGQVFLNPG